MDIKELGTQNEVINVIHPQAGDVGIKFTVCDPLSAEFANASARIDRSKSGSDWSSFVINQALCAVVGWSGVENGEGDDAVPVEFAPEAVKELLTNPKYYWMCVAVDEHFGKKKGYMQTIMNRLKPS